MRKLALILFVLNLAAGLQQVRAGRCDDAFERRSADGLKHMMTADHVAVTPYYGAPQSVAGTDRVAELQADHCRPVTVEVLGPDAGMRTFSTRLNGTFMGKPIPSDVFVTGIMAREHGRWREKFYQVTAMRP